jgi:hypothetical protein
MTITVACPRCGTRLRAPDDMAGQTARCSQCQGRMLLPPPEEVAEPPAEEVDAAFAGGYEDEGPRSPRPGPRGRGVGFVCPFCRCRARPERRTQVSTGGWVVFAMFILLCLPLCFIGLLMREEYRVCSNCGTRLG